MRDLNLVVFLWCLISFLPTFHCQVPGYGNQNSIGKSPYPPSSFYPDETWGVNNANDNRWPNGIVPYIFDHNSSDPSDNITLTPALAVKMVAQLQGFMNNTCIKFVPRTNQTDYVAFRFSTGCSSYVGRIGGRQNVNMRPWCFPTIHEVMHALGFGHEEIRRDRDYYVAFNWTNVKPDYYDRNNLPTYGTPLDPKSIMMSSQWAGQINSIYPVFFLPDKSNPDVHAAFKYYSEGDRQKINRAYNCIAEDTCWDEDPFNCPVWAAAGTCKDPNWVPKTACPKKCCVDRSSRCVKDQLHCNTTSWAGWCNKTCNFCPTKDNRNDCQYIGATLGCNRDPVKWPGGMTKYCRKSCRFCTRPAVVNIPPMILTKCNKTCHEFCNTITGCNPLARPKPNDWSDNYCSGPNWPIPKLLDWCKTNPRAIYCETTCFNLGVKRPCPRECADSDPVNCPKLAATKGCFSLYTL